MASSAGALAPSVQTPIQLSTYGRPRAKACEDVCCSHASSLVRSHVAVGDVVRLGHHGVRRRRGLVVTLEQGVAVVLMDLQTQTPVHTYTLKPSDRACTPPLVVERSVPGATKQLLRTTYVGIADGPSSTSLWALTEALDARGKHVPGAETSHAAHAVPGVVTSWQALGDGRLLAVRDDGALLLLSDPTGAPSVQVLDTYAAPPVRHDMLVLDAAAAQPLYGRVDDDGARPTGAVLLAVSERKRPELSVHAVGVYASAPYLRARSARVPDMDATSLASCSLDASGQLAALSRDGTLYTTALHVAERLTIASPRTITLRVHDGRLVFLSAAHLLIVCVRDDLGKLRAAALLWDEHLDTVLAQVEWSAGTGSAKDASLSVRHCLDDYVVVQLQAGEKSALKGGLAALPFAVPAAGLLRHALHSSERTAAWLATPPPPPAAPPSHAALLASLATLPTEPRARALALDDKVRAWLHAEAERLRAAEHIKAGRKAPKVPLDAALVRALLLEALPPPTSPAGAAWAGETVRYLLERNAVTLALVPDLVPRALATQDWGVLLLVLRHVPDVSEAEAMQILARALAARDDEAAPPVARVLQHVLAPPALAKPALRMALRTHIQREDDVLILLDMVMVWLQTQLRAPLEGKAPRPDAQLRTVPHTALTYRTGDVPAPSLEACLSFAEDLVDTFFPHWLASPRTHAFLRDVTHTLTQHTQSLQTLARLRAPLDAVARAPASSAAERTTRQGWQEASLLVPTYSVETLEL